MRLCTHFPRLISLLHCPTFLALIHAFIQCKAGRNRPAEKGKVPLVQYRVIQQNFTHLGIHYFVCCFRETWHLSTILENSQLIYELALMDHLVSRAAPSSSPAPLGNGGKEEEKKGRALFLSRRENTQGNRVTMTMHERVKIFEFRTRKDMEIA